MRDAEITQSGELSRRQKLLRAAGFRSPYSPSGAKRYRLLNCFDTPTALLPHQVVGIRKILQHRGFFLNDDPGLGKTIQALYANLALKQARRIDGIVVICYARHVRVWKKQLKQHARGLNLRVQILSGKTRERRKYKNNCDIWIVTYELLAQSPFKRRAKGSKQSRRKRRSMRDVPREYRLRATDGRTIAAGIDALRLKRLLISKRISLIIDESQAIMNPVSATTTTLLALGAFAARKLAMTGTPFAEHTWNLFSQVLFADDGATFGKSYLAFLDRYAECEYFGRRAKPKYGKNLKELHRKLKPISLRRRRSECLGLPPSIIRSEPIDMGVIQARLFDTLRLKLIDALHAYALKYGIDARLPAFDREEDSVSKLMAQLDRAAAMPETINPAITHSAKYDHVKSVLYDEGKKQVAIYCFHRDVADAVHRRLQRDKINSVLVSGKIPVKKRDPLIDGFVSGRYRVLVATQGALADAETMTNCERVIAMQRSYSLLKWVQSVGRFERIGTTGTVLWDVLETQRGIDRHRTYVLEMKQREADAVQDGKFTKKSDVFTVRRLLDFLL